MAGELGHRLGPQLFADRRVIAIGANQQIIAAARAVGEGDIHAVTLIGECLKRHPQPHRNAQLGHLITQHLVQRGARQAEVGRQAIDRGIAGQFLQHRAIHVAESGAAIGIARLHRAVADSQNIERPHEIGLHDDADMIDFPVLVALDHLNAHALLMEADSHRQTADAAADNQNFLNLAHDGMSLIS